MASARLREITERYTQIIKRIKATFEFEDRRSLN
jgi:hypothetical protein